MNADRFDGHTVTISGRITNLHQDSLFGRPSYMFDLGDGNQTIRVFASGKAPCQAGDRATVEGTFQKVKGQAYITAAKAICGPQGSN